jgi:DNA-binding GntR family transcriptional regulator
MPTHHQPLKVKKVYIGDRVYREIRRMLVDRAIAPGERIDKSALSAQLGVSPTPVNEAIKRLVGEDLVEMRGTDGFYSRRYGPQDMIDLHEARAAIEGMAIRLCIEKLSDEALDELTHFYDSFTFPLSAREELRYGQADRAFHEKLIVDSGNAVFVKFIRAFNLMTSSYQMGLMRPPAETIVEHQAMIRAIRARNAELAHHLVLDHHMRSRNAFRERVARGELDGV